MPAFGEAGIKVINNGPLAFPPDGCPLVGPMNNYPGLWLASGFPVGVGTGGGAAQYLADFMVSGAPETFIPAIDPNRFKKPIPKNDAIAQMCQHYAAGYLTPGSSVKRALQ